MKVKVEKGGRIIHYPDKRTFVENMLGGSIDCCELNNWERVIISYLKRNEQDKVWLGRACYFCNGNDVLKSFDKSCTNEIIGHVKREGDLLCCARQNR